MIMAARDTPTGLAMRMAKAVPRAALGHGIHHLLHHGSSLGGQSLALGEEWRWNQRRGRHLLLDGALALTLDR